jgi:hypothetical protein
MGLYDLVVWAVDEGDGGPGKISVYGQRIVCSDK